MNQCVPSWDVDENPLSPSPTLDYEVAELTWENGQLAMHGLGLPRVPNKTTTTTTSSPTKYTWEKPRAGGTLESIVNQATSLPHPKSSIGGGCSGTGDEVVPWFAVPSTASGCSASMNTAAALVPCTNTNTTTKNGHGPSTHVLESLRGFGTPTPACSTRVESCSGVPDVNLARAGTAAQEWSSRADHSVSNSATWGRDSRQVTLDTCERDMGTVGFTSTSTGSPENTSSAKQWAKTADDHDSVCHDRSQAEVGDDEDKKKGKSSTSTKRSRAAAIHNQSERKRRDKINQRMKTLQKLIPNSSKTDKASMLDEVIEYLKQLQAQVQMMSRVNMSTMMLPMAMQQQLQMSMMAAPMGMAGMAAASMGMAGMGAFMDMNSLGRANIPGLSPVLHPGAFMPMASWDGNGDRLPTSISAMPDPLSAFLACQSQPMTMDAYCRIASLYQQFQQQPGPSSKN